VSAGRTIDRGALIPVARPTIGEAELGAVERPLRSGWLTQGPEVAAFEREFAEFVGAPYACAVSNCTTALHLALRVLDVKPGDEVVTVSHSFIATANAVRYCGAVPVFADVQPDTYNIDPERIAPLVTRQTRALLVVHQLGMPCDMEAILLVAQAAGIPVVEDAACAAGSELRVADEWHRIGRPHGDVACFSFHPRKVLTTGDGGMLTTRSAEWDRRFRLWRQHSMTVPDSARHLSREVVIEQYSELGFNYRLTDLQAAIGREQLKRLPDIVQRRRALADRYRALLADIPGITLPHEPDWARSNWQSYCIILPPRCDQRLVMQSMLDAGIATRRGVMSAHREPAYAAEPWRCAGGAGRCTCLPGSCDALGCSEETTDRGLILPLYVGMTDADQARVAGALADAVATSRSSHAA
jgi:dTDP-4-amino-4,6-dideoxygalactose transaminase